MPELQPKRNSYSLSVSVVTITTRGIPLSFTNLTEAVTDRNDIPGASSKI